MIVFKSIPRSRAMRRTGGFANAGRSDAAAASGRPGGGSCAPLAVADTRSVGVTSSTLRETGLAVSYDSCTWSVSGTATMPGAFRGRLATAPAFTPYPTSIEPDSLALPISTGPVTISAGGTSSTDP